MAEVKDKVITVESLKALHEHNKNTYIAKTDIISVDKGGTGADNAATARTNLDITPANIGAEPSFYVLPIIKGGTSASNGATGLKNLFASGNTVLSSYQYGDTLPTAGTKGRIFFKRLTDV